MELSHAISDTVLTLSGLFVFFYYLRKLNFLTCLLWEAFILSVVAASFFGVIRFLGNPQARPISEFFQHLAGTAGAISLVAAAYLLIIKKTNSRNYTFGTLFIGFILFTFVQIGNYQTVLKGVSTIAIPLVLLIGILGLIKGKTAESLWLIFGVIALILATFNKNIFTNFPLDSIDMYHYLLAISLLCLGKASSKNIN